MTQEKALQKSIQVGAILIGQYRGAKVKIEFKCPQCSDIFKRIPSNVWHRKQILCNKCSLKQYAQKRTFTQKQAEQKSKKMGAILVGEYKNITIKTKFQCPQCNKIFERTPKAVWFDKLILCKRCGLKQRAKKKSHAFKEKSLGFLYPEIAKLYSKNNDISVFKINPSSHTKRKWICKKYGHEHEYETRPYHMIKGNRCPYCNGKKVKIGFNDLASQYPEIAKEWHPTKNGDLKPTDVTSKSGKRAWWLCLSHNHEWQAKIYSRTLGHGCPNCCPKSKGEEKIKQLLNIWDIKYIYNKRFPTCKNKNTLPFDFYLPYYNLLIEFHGKQHYQICTGYFKSKSKLKQRKKHDQIKKQWTKNNDIPLLIISYEQINDIENILKGELQIT